jgi:DNA modification methylase
VPDTIPESLRALAVPIDSITPHPRNARTHDDAAIRESLAYHGQYRPIVVQRSTAYVLAGNGTLSAARELDWPEIAVTYVDCDDEQAARILLVDNRANDQAGYDDALLADLLSSLPDLDGTGYDASALAELLADAETQPVEPTGLPVHESPPGVVIVQADARNLPLPDDTVDLIVTSPPYFALRSYQDGGEHYAGQIGSEESPEEWLDALWTCTREWVRVVKPGGSLFVNLGDKYSNDGPSGPQGATGTVTSHRSAQYADMSERQRSVGYGAVRPKSLIGLPWRYAIGCIDQLGLILRAEIIWDKPNSLPESVTDRVRRSHEQWFHFVQQPHYYSAVDEIRETHRKVNPGSGGLVGGKYSEQRGDGARGQDLAQVNPLGKLPGSVWEIPSEPLIVPEGACIDHFAAFPSEWPRRLVLGWSPRGICTKCGEGRRPVTSVTLEPTGSFVRGKNGKGGPAHLNPSHDLESGSSAVVGHQSAVISGYTCACPDPSARTRPAVVLDPFGGTGTTALVASVLGRVGISVDLSADYCKLARWRTSDPGQRAKVAARGEVGGSDAHV